MVAKKYQNPSGGLNEAGRKYFKNKDGSNLKRQHYLSTQEFLDSIKENLDSKMN